MILVNFLRYSYAVLAGLGLVCELVPWTREALIRYGRTMTKPDDDATKDKDKQAAAARANASPSRLSAAMIHYAAWKVPKSLFTHFYIVGAIVSGLLTIDTIAWFNSQSEFQHTGAAPHHFIPRILAFEQWLAGSIQSDVHDVRPDRLAVLALALFTLHVLLRLKESAYDQPATSAKMHASQYSVGVVFYILAPLGVVVDSYQAPGWKPQSPWLVVAGVAVYVYAFIHQRRCHGILFQLRNRCLSKQ
ncbi:Steroid 5 alpha-reductase 3, partial [Coemansia sp. RSA 2320]